MGQSKDNINHFFFFFVLDSGDKWVQPGNLAWRVSHRCCGRVERAELTPKISSLIGLKLDHEESDSWGRDCCAAGKFS